MLEPKLKKAFMTVRLEPGTSNLKDEPECIFCGEKIGKEGNYPSLKITHGAPSRTFRLERQTRHRHIEVKFLSIEQVLRKVEDLTSTKRNKLRFIDLPDFRHQDKDLFWNTIYYFNSHDLPYDHILLYKDNDEIDEIEHKFNHMNSNC